MKTRAHSSPRGTTLIEIVIASALLSMLALMSLSAIQASGTQAHFTSNRADVFRRVNAVMTRLERDLEGASYQDSDNAVGNFNAVGRSMTPVVPVVGMTTDAISFQSITGFNPNPGPPNNVTFPNGMPLTGNTIIYAFERLEPIGNDTDNDGLPGEYQLVRIDTVTNQEVVIQANVLGQGQTGLTSGAIANPTFVLNPTNTSELVITFSLGKVIGMSGGVRNVTATTVTRNLSLRNLQ